MAGIPGPKSTCFLSSWIPFRLQLGSASQVWGHDTWSVFEGRWVGLWVRVLEWIRLALREIIRHHARQKGILRFRLQLGSAAANRKPYRASNLKAAANGGSVWADTSQKWLSAPHAVLPTAVGGFRESNPGPLAPEDYATKPNPLVLVWVSKRYIWQEVTLGCGKWIL